MEIDLIVQCPDKNCNYTNEKTQWKCANCYEKVKLKNDGYVKCSGQGKCIDVFIQFVNFLCKCKSHQIGHRYTEASDFILALSTAIKAAKISENINSKVLNQFVADLATNLNIGWKH
jgi:hypothetical protein